jgi:hypothetical protein
VSEDSLLTDDELAFIRDLLGTPRLGMSLSAPQLCTDTSHAMDLLKRLANGGKLTLEARIEGQSLTFPLTLMGDEPDNLQLQIGAPEILEHGPITRPWRLHLEQPMVLMTPDNGSTGLQVWELSLDGALIQAVDGAELPISFNLLLPLPTGAIAVVGTQVRTTRARMAAYRFDLDEKGTEHLRQYLFEHLDA